MGHADAWLAIRTARTVRFAATVGCIDGLIDSENNVGNRDVAGKASQGIAASGSAHAFNQLVAAQLAKKLLQIGKGNILALADGRQRDRATVLPEGQIDHCSNGETSFCREPHDGFPKKVMKVSALNIAIPTKRLKYKPIPSIFVS